MIRAQKVVVQVGSEWLVTRVHREHSFHQQTHVAKSHALFCPACQEVWAILKFEDDDDDYVWPVAQFCEHHKPEGLTKQSGWFPVPGSILVEEGWGVIDDSLLRALPKELLRREFDLHVRAYQ